MAGSASLLHAEPDRILVTIGAHLDDVLGLARHFALTPERIARTAEIPGLAARDGFAQRFLVHMRDHQHLACRGIGRDASEKPGRIEFRLERQPLFAIVDISR